MSLGTLSASQHIRQETFMSIIINVILSWLFFLLMFRKVDPIPLWGAANLALDFVPQSFMIAFMATLVPGAITLRKRDAGVIERLPTGSRLPRSLLMRALLLAGISVICGGGATVLILRALGIESVDWTTGLIIKLVYGAALAALVTPFGLRAALASN